MGFYFIILLILILLAASLIIWLIRLVKLFKKGKEKRKSFWIQLAILTLLTIVILWYLRIFPFSQNFYIRDQTEKLTGQTFWSWKDYHFEEISVRGEGYTIDIYSFNEEMADYFKNPPDDFFTNYPDSLEHRQNWIQEKWKPTPVSDKDKEYLNQATPNYSNWTDKTIEKMNFVRQLANSSGGYYAYKSKHGDVDFYIIFPEKRLIIMINHNM